MPRSPFASSRRCASTRRPTFHAWHTPLVMLCCLLLASLSPAPVFALAAPPSPEAWRQSPQLTVRDAPPCRYGQTQRVADIQMKDIPEASALVASLQWPGVYWTVNDAHNEARLNAFDQ